MDERIREEVAGVVVGEDIMYPPRMDPFSLPPLPAFPSCAPSGSVVYQREKRRKFWSRKKHFVFEVGHEV